jgi:hypothetical protein
MKPLSPHDLLVIGILLAASGFWLCYKSGMFARRALDAVEWILLVACILCALLAPFLRPPHNGRWDAPILGRYHLYMINTTDSAALYDSSVPGVFDNGVLLLPGHRDIIFGVHDLELRPPLIFGTATPTAYYNSPQPYDKQLFFLLDTRTASRTDYPSIDSLERAAEKLGGPIKLQRVDAVFNRGRRKSTRAQLIVIELSLFLGVSLVIRAFLVHRRRLLPARNEQLIS